MSKVLNNEYFFISKEPIDGISEGALKVYSPRVQCNFPDINDNIVAHYCCQKDEYPDIYMFMLACRAKKTNTNHYHYEKTRDQWDIIRLGGSTQEQYHLASGETLPKNMPIRQRELLYKYMMEGLHTFLLFHARGLSKYTEDENGICRTVNKVTFQDGEGWAVNMSNVFVSMLVDYYRIESGIPTVNTQNDFMSNPQIRIRVYQYLRDVFISFILKNTPSEYDNIESVPLKGNYDMEGKIAILVANILNKYISF